MSQQNGPLITKQINLYTCPYPFSWHRNGTNFSVFQVKKIGYLEEGIEGFSPRSVGLHVS
jgi:hypothetical protein